MKPLSLLLKGFRGIRDGLGRDAITLDFERLAGDGQLVALKGMNGRGKTTIMDNLTPYPVMPSRAGADGLGSFSYYDHVFLPESVKDLAWEHEGRRYRSQLVFRTNGRKKTESYLHVWNAGRWEPMRLPDGTVSDGKVDTYERCIEAVLGSAETFFTSVFSPQGRRQLCAYKNAEIKTLLADLLGLDEIRQVGAQAAETAKLIRAGLTALRQELGGLKTEESTARAERARFGDVQARTVAAERQRAAAQTALDTEKSRLAQMSAERQVARQTEARRKQLNDERSALIDAGMRALAALDEQDRREAERLVQIERRAAKRAESLRTGRAALDARRNKLVGALRHAPRIAHAVRRLLLAQSVTAARERRLLVLRETVAQFDALCANEKERQMRLGAIEREAGQAVLRTQELARRFALTAEVPCSGTDLQSRCKLLGDAREAKSLMPSADAQIARLEAERTQVLAQLRTTKEALARLRGPRKALAHADGSLQRARCRSATLAVTAARETEIEQARGELVRIDAELNSLPRAEGGESNEMDEDRVERKAISDARDAIARTRAQERQRYQASIARIDTTLAALPAPFDAAKLDVVERGVAAAQRSLAATDAAHMNAIRDQQTAAEYDKRIAAFGTRIATAEARLATIEEALGAWTLFAKCLSNDGVIALAIDDAGPQLAGLANDLLLACYGPRFTVSIRTLVETGKGDAREGFDIVVHDAESDESKSVTLMSGGERVWINDCLTRAIALYLAQDSGRRYQTLFSDETDGPLDSERKRMFMAMKREVLRLGGYQQEFFVSQTPELAAMADAVIDLDAMVVGDGARTTEAT